MSTRKHILVVDDEKDLCDLISYNLRKAGYDVAAVHTGRAALDYVSEKSPDLVVLDVMLPELTGTEVASRIRSNPATASVPIVMVTAKGAEVDQLVGLTVGADDYISKPFSTRILLARIEAVLRRTGGAPQGGKALTLGAIEVHTDTHEVLVDGEPIKLTLTEFKLLAALISAGGKVLSRSVLMARAMGPGITVTERTIDVHITSVRRKLGPHAGIVKTIRGVGYKATPDEETADAGEALP
ncbi:MAG: response regulator transcription factor [Phycisphaerales bacterium]